MPESAVLKKRAVSKVSQHFTEEFEKYLKMQSLKAAFNGCDIEDFSWYKKALGIGF